MAALVRTARSRLLARKGRPALNEGNLVMRVTIFGTGYVGLVTGTCLAEVGNDVVCVDVDAGKVARLERGEIPIYEPGPRAARARQPSQRTPEVHDRRRHSDGAGAGCLHRGRHAARRGRQRGSDARARSRAHDRPHADQARRRRQQVDRAGRHRRLGARRDRGRARRARRRASRSMSSRIRNSSRRAMRCRTACARTASSSAPTARARSTC